MEICSGGDMVSIISVAVGVVAVLVALYIAYIQKRYLRHQWIAEHTVEQISFISKEDLLSTPSLYRRYYAPFIDYQIKHGTQTADFDVMLVLNLKKSMAIEKISVTDIRFKREDQLEKLAVITGAAEVNTQEISGENTYQTQTVPQIVLYLLFNSSAKTLGKWFVTNELKSGRIRIFLKCKYLHELAKFRIGNQELFNIELHIEKVYSLDHGPSYNIINEIYQSERVF